MIRYICNLCKGEISQNSDLAVIKTQLGDKSTTAHLHHACLHKIKKVCSVNLKNFIAEETQTATNNDQSTTIKELTENTEYRENFSLKLECFNPGIPTTGPRAGSVINMQRILLCLYKGDKLTAIADKLKIAYSAVFNAKSKYSSQEIAKRHLMAPRMYRQNVEIIDEFIEHGNVLTIANNANLTEKYVKDVISYYTGLTW